MLRQRGGCRRIRPEDSPNLPWCLGADASGGSRGWSCAETDRGLLWLAPVCRDSDDPSDAYLLVVLETEEQWAGTTFAATNGSFDPTEAVGMGGLTLGVAPDSVGGVMLVTDSGEVQAEVRNNIWFVPSDRAPLTSTVVVG